MTKIILTALMIISSPSYPQLIDLEKVDSSIKKDIRYFSTYNFVGEFIDGYNAPKCLLVVDAAEALAKVQYELKQHGLSLLVYDCYRPQKAVDHFVRWSQTKDEKMKLDFYPNLQKDDLFKLGYIAKQSGHTTGRSVDVTLIPISKQELKIERHKTLKDCTKDGYFKGGSIDMGSAYDCFHKKSHTMSDQITKLQMKNRVMLKDIMEKYGFENYEKEWWHFTYLDAPDHRYKQNVK